MFSARPVFVDTGFWIAFFNAQDFLHAKARSLFIDINQNGGRLICTSAVLIETLDGFSSHNARHHGVTLRRITQQLQQLEIVHIDETLFARGWDLYESRADKSWSLTDCLSFVVMQEREITDALAHDHHFEQAGFRALLRD